MPRDQWTLGTVEGSGQSGTECEAVMVTKPMRASLSPKGGPLRYGAQKAAGKDMHAAIVVIVSSRRRTCGTRRMERVSVAFAGSDAAGGARSTELSTGRHAATRKAAKATNGKAKPPRM